MTSKRDEVYVIGVIPRASWDSDATSLPCAREDLIAAFANFHGDLLRVLDAVEDVSLWPIYDRERNDRWSGDRVVCCDARQPVPPAAAGGGNSRGRRHPEPLPGDVRRPADAFRCYEAARIPGVGDVQRISLEGQLDARADRNGLVLF